MLTQNCWCALIGDVGTVLFYLEPIGKMSAGEWCLIESDPGVFTELIKGFGERLDAVPELQQVDLHSYDSHSVH